MIIRIDNPDLSLNEKTFLSSRASDGDTSLTVDNNEGFAANDWIVIGGVGEEKTEAVKISSVSGDHTIVAATAAEHDHPRGTPIYFTSYNKWSLDVKPSGGSYALVSGFPKDIEWDDEYSEYIYSGATTDTYKFRFYNSQTGAYSSYSPEIAGTGHTRQSVRYMTDRVYLLAKDPDMRVATRAEILQMFNAAQDFVSAIFDKPNFLWKEGTAIASVASQVQYAFPSDLDKLQGIICHFDDGSTNKKYPLKYISLLTYDDESKDQDADDDDDTQFYTVFPSDSTYSNGSFKVWPVPDTAVHDFYPRYWKKMTDLADDNDETDIPIPQILEYWALAELERIRGNEKKAQTYLSFLPDGRIDARSTAGQYITLLRRWERRRRATGQPYGFKFRGQRYLSSYYGERDIYDENERINYW